MTMTIERDERNSGYNRSNSGSYGQVSSALWEATQRLRAGAVLTERGRILSWGILPKLLKKEAKKQSTKC